MILGHDGGQADMFAEAFKRCHVILRDVVGERARQQECFAAGRFGFAPYPVSDPRQTNGVRLTVLVEELGEVARAAQVEDGIATDGGTDLRRELVQLCAVAVAWVEAIDARKAGT